MPPFTITVTEVQNCRHLGLHLVGFMSGRRHSAGRVFACVRDETLRYLKEWQKCIVRFYCTNDGRRLRRRCRFYRGLPFYNVCIQDLSRPLQHRKLSQPTIRRQNTVEKQCRKGVIFLSCDGPLHPWPFVIRFLAFPFRFDQHIVTCSDLFHFRILWYLLCVCRSKHGKIVRTN